jgi:hypothetical protein
MVGWQRFTPIARSDAVAVLVTDDAADESEIVVCGSEASRW